MSFQAVLYSDLNCPFCYALEERLVAAGALTLVEWRGVQHEPGLPAPMEIATYKLSRTLEKEVLTVRETAPEVEIFFPLGKPNTSLAIEYVAAAQKRDAMLAALYRHTLAREFWVHGSDLSDEKLLQAWGQEVGLPFLSSDKESHETALIWQSEWEKLGTGSVPTLQREDGALAVGLMSVESIREFFGL